MSSPVLNKSAPCYSGQRMQWSMPTSRSSRTLPRPPTTTTMKLRSVGISIAMRSVEFLTLWWLLVQLCHCLITKVQTMMTKPMNMEKSVRILGEPYCRIYGCQNTIRLTFSLLLVDFFHLLHPSLSQLVLSSPDPLLFTSTTINHSKAFLWTRSLRYLVYLIFVQHWPTTSTMSLLILKFPTLLVKESLCRTPTCHCKLSMSGTRSIFSRRFTTILLLSLLLSLSIPTLQTHIVHLTMDGTMRQL